MAIATYGMTAAADTKRPAIAKRRPVSRPPLLLICLWATSPTMKPTMATATERGKATQGVYGAEQNHGGQAIIATAGTRIAQLRIPRTRLATAV